MSPCLHHVHATHAHSAHPAHSTTTEAAYVHALVHATRRALLMLYDTEVINELLQFLATLSDTGQHIESCRVRVLTEELGIVVLLVGDLARGDYLIEAAHEVLVLANLRALFNRRDQKVNLGAEDLYCVDRSGHSLC